MSRNISLIPVIDLLGGHVVRGVRGERRAYRPIVSALCNSSDPVTVARILCEHADAQRLYVADLDALMGGGAQLDALCALLAALPGVELWLDAGFADAAAAATLISQIDDAGESRITPVFGSETLASRRALADACGVSGRFDGRAVLSLDRRGAELLDAAGCWQAQALWPARVIVMTLERVGADAGPDLDTLRAVRLGRPDGQVIGAGGIRHADDLRRAAEMGADAWLVASALHDLRLPALPRA